MRPEPADLRAIPLFSSLDESDLVRISEWTEVRHVEAGERVTLAGATGYGFFIIQDGDATVTVEGKGLRSLGPGDFFGEMAILGKGRRTADVVATSPMTLVFMFGTEFRLMEAGMPQVAGQIRKAMEGRT
jgi:CRP/FNR family transcriptional regulator, cyclic AMP receptor protein